MKKGSNAPDRKSGQYAGSPKPGEPVYLVIGRLRKPHGVMGEILMDVLTEFPERFDPQQTVYIGNEHRKMVVVGRRWHQDSLLIHLEGVNDCDQAGHFRNTLVYGTTSTSPKLPEGEYYQHELVGLTVLDESGETLGELTEILTTGSNDVYVVHTPAGGEILLPALKSVILTIDLSAKRMIVKPPEWA